MVFLSKQKNTLSTILKDTIKQNGRTDMKEEIKKTRGQAYAEAFVEVEKRLGNVLALERYQDGFFIRYHNSYMEDTIRISDVTCDNKSYIWLHDEDAVSIKIPYKWDEYAARKEKKEKRRETKREQEIYKSLSPEEQKGCDELKSFFNKFND